MRSLGTGSKTDERPLLRELECEIELPVAVSSLSWTLSKSDKYARHPIAPFVHHRLLIFQIASEIVCRAIPEEKSIRCLTYVSRNTNVTYMEKTQVYLRKEELDALRKAAVRSGRSVAELVRDAIRKVVLKPQAAAGPVAIWDGDPKRTSVDHDSVHDEP